MHQPYVDVVLVKQLYFNKTNYSLGHFSWMQSHVFCFTEVQLCFHRAPHQLIRNHILTVKVQINLTFDHNKILRHISLGVSATWFLILQGEIPANLIATSVWNKRTLLYWQSVVGFVVVLPFSKLHRALLQYK